MSAKAGNATPGTTQPTNPTLAAVQLRQLAVEAGHRASWLLGPGSRWGDKRWLQTATVELKKLRKQEGRQQPDEPPRFVRRWFTRFKETGSVGDKQRTGRPQKLHRPPCRWHALSPQCAVPHRPPPPHPTPLARNRRGGSCLAACPPMQLCTLLAARTQHRTAQQTPRAAPGWCTRVRCAWGRGSRSM